jgi:predicted nucleotidyltransferase
MKHLDKEKRGANMKKETDLDQIMTAISRFSERAFVGKLDKVILYGSYARGDFDEESDIDVMIVVDMDENELYAYEALFTEFSSDASLENEVLIVPFLCSKERFDTQAEYVPFIQNVNKEGRVVYA